MSNESKTEMHNGLPGPMRFVLGLTQIVIGIPTGMIGAVCKVLPVTSVVGSPLSKLGYKLCYDGGANLVRSFKSRSNELSTEQLFPPAK